MPEPSGGPHLLAVLRDSPFAEALADGSLDLERRPDFGRDVGL